MAEMSNLELMRRAAERLGEQSDEGARLVKIRRALQTPEFFEYVEGHRRQDDLHAPAHQDLATLLPILAPKFEQVPEVAELLARYILKVRDACPAVGWPPTAWVGSGSRIVMDYSRPEIAGARALSKTVHLEILDEGLVWSTSLPVEDAAVRQALVQALSDAKGTKLDKAGDVSFYVVRGQTR